MKVMKRLGPYLSDWFTDLVCFHNTLGVTIGDTPAFRDVPLRMSLIEEEIGELKDAVAKGDFPEAIDAVIDSIYVLIGAAVAWGVDLRPIWDAVHKANMAKVGGPVREDGKRLKPEGWKPADVAELLRRLGWEP